VGPLTHALAGASLGLAVAGGAAEPGVGVAAAVLGGLAGIAPDIDVLIGLGNPLRAWRWHRVLTHNVLAVAVLALAVWGLGQAFVPEQRDHALLLGAACVLGAASHLVLDLLTGFGTAVLYPFTSRRWSWGTHFLTDPLWTLALGVGLAASRPALGLGLCGLHLVLAVALRARTAARVRSLLAPGTRFHLEAEPLSPWRWWVVIPRDDRYQVAHASPLRVEPWKEVHRGTDSQAARLAGSHPLMAAYLAIARFPRFADCSVGGRRGVVVEDVRWWFVLPFRPMALYAEVEEGELVRPRETRKWDRGPAGEAEPVPWISAR
jgi:membrane-bound metal-dependent hydrolase YbcI (DUF457 family)